MSDFLYSTAEIRAIEAAHARKKPKESLMLRAGGAVAALASKIAKKKRGASILVLAGPGNNGGDAWVAAAALKKAGQIVTVLAPSEQKNPDPAAKSAMTAYRKAKGALITKFPSDEKFDLIIDGLFGIGLQRAPAGAFADAIKSANANADRHHTPILAIDVPSGLSADTGVEFGATIQADFTITFLGAKPGLYTADGVEGAGKIHVESLGVEDAASQGHLLNAASVAPLIPKRRKNSHKGSFGNVGIIGGASGMMGAAVLSARAALHMGPGKVFLGFAAKDAPGIDTINPEIMVRTAEEVVADESLTSLAVGMGLGIDKTAPRLLSAALARALPMVIDADALTLIAANPSIHAVLEAKMAGTPHQTLSLVFTPHPGEAARLLGVTTDEIQSDRVSAAKSIATKFKAVTVLKGAGTIIAAPDGRYWINTSGNPGMASGGMGDALSGMIAAFLAQGMDALNAAKLGVYLHGAAADECLAHGMAPHGLTASEVIFEARTLLNAGLQAHAHEHE
ncbi:MAG: NAD(P)H-hydrate dehydratase [Burkholderiales bacterium]|nr:NAD(P)H-hydrate dehydratase [Burkholderiales bacterium]